MEWKYLYHALMSHIRYRENTYDYGGMNRFRNDCDRGKKLMDFNLKQQTSILQNAYLNLIELDYDDIWREVILDLEC